MQNKGVGKSWWHHVVVARSWCGSLEKFDLNFTRLHCPEFISRQSQKKRHESSQYQVALIFVRQFCLSRVTLQNGQEKSYAFTCERFVFNVRHLWRCEQRSQHNRAYFTLKKARWNTKKSLNCRAKSLWINYFLRYGPFRGWSFCEACCRKKNLEL